MGGRCIAQNINGAKRQQQLKFLSFNYDIDINSNSTENEFFDKLHAYLLKCVHASWSLAFCKSSWFWRYWKYFDNTALSRWFGLVL